MSQVETPVEVEEEPREAVEPRTEKREQEEPPDPWPAWFDEIPRD